MANASKVETPQKGLNYRQYPGAKASWTELQQKTPDTTGVTGNIKEFTLSIKSPYSVRFEGYLEIPVSGGYTFYMMSRDGAYLQVDDVILVNSNATQPQVCNSVGNVVKQHTSTSILEAGLHKISVGYKQDLGSEVFAFYWQGPANKLEQIPIDRFFRRM